MKLSSVVLTAWIGISSFAYGAECTKHDAPFNRTNVDGILRTASSQANPTQRAGVNIPIPSALKNFIISCATTEFNLKTTAVATGDQIDLMIEAVGNAQKDVDVAKCKIPSVGTPAEEFITGRAFTVTATLKMATCPSANWGQWALTGPATLTHANLFIKPRTTTGALKLEFFLNFDSQNRTPAELDSFDLGPLIKNLGPNDPTKEASTLAALDSIATAIAQQAASAFTAKFNPDFMALVQPLCADPVNRACGGFNVTNGGFCDTEDCKLFAINFASNTVGLTYNVNDNCGIDGIPGELCGNHCGPDADRDGLPDACDLCPSIPSMPQGQGIQRQADKDGDQIGDLCDNCKDVANPDQYDGDRDGIGSACDICPNIPGNGRAGVANRDSDGDRVNDPCDNCVSIANANQLDTDGDKIGDACDPCPKGSIWTDPVINAGRDLDRDGFQDKCDSCPTIANRNQADTDLDKLGDSCDFCSSNPTQCLLNACQTGTPANNGSHAAFGTCGMMALTNVSTYFDFGRFPSHVAGALFPGTRLSGTNHNPLPAQQLSSCPTCLHRPPAHFKVSRAYALRGVANGATGAIVPIVYDGSDGNDFAFSAIAKTSGFDVWQFGGTDSSGRLTNRMALLRGNSIREVTPNNSNNAGPAPRAGATAVYDNANRKLYVFAGFQQSGPTTDLWVYSLESNQWENLALNAPFTVHSFPVLFLTNEGRALITLGSTDGFKTLNVLGMFDVRRRRWITRTIRTGIPSRVAAASALDETEKNLWVFGGFNGAQGVLDDFWRINLATGSTARISIPARIIKKPSQPQARMGAELIKEGAGFLLIGGYNPSGLHTPETIWKFDGRHWVRMASDGLFLDQAAIDRVYRGR